MIKLIILIPLLYTLLYANDNSTKTAGETSAFSTYYYRDKDGDYYGNLYEVKKGGNKPPKGYVSNSADCNDEVATINPVAPEICDEIDNDCDGFTDDGFSKFYYFDGDKDGYGDLASQIYTCAPPDGYIKSYGDCNDNDPTITFTRSFFNDADGDGYGNANIYTEQICTPPDGYVANSDDCDDNDPLAHGTFSEELCDGVDNNCDGEIDEHLIGRGRFYRDLDKDGYGYGFEYVFSCVDLDGYAANNLDCDDGNFTINPGAEEICDGIDNDCDFKTDEELRTVFYPDYDGDGYGNPLGSVLVCTAPPGYVTNNTDCNDHNEAIRPGATEICDGLDNDCDGQIDEDVLTSFYPDADVDGYGNNQGEVLACSAPAGYITDNTDCNDNDATINPGAAEICDEKDNDCDRLTDEDVAQVFFRDGDGDGHGSGPGIFACTAPPGYVTSRADCDDTDPTVHFYAPEIIDGKDNDCDGLVDEIEPGSSINKSPGANQVAVEKLNPQKTSLYPNPVQNKLTITLSTPADQIIAIEVVSAAGRTSLKNRHKVVGVNNIELYVNGLRAGIYFLRIQTRQGFQTVKFIKAQ